MKQTVLRYGFKSGAILSALMVVTILGAKLIGWEPSGTTGMAMGYTTMVLSFLLIHSGIRSYRDTVMGGAVSFWGALKVGLLIALIASACYAATWQVVYRTVLPDYAEHYADQALKAAQKRGDSAAEIEKMRTEMAKFAVMYKNPLYNFGMTILEPLPVGILLSLISAGMLSRKRREVLSTLGGAVS